VEEKDVLLGFLEAQRAVVLAILDGLDDAALTKPVGPLGWTPLGMVEHLAHAERHWFQEVVTGFAEPLAWPDENTPLNTTRTPEVVFAFYRDQRDRANAIIAGMPLDSSLKGSHPGPLGAEVTDLRRVILHMIEETARHAGHLDIARELIDGTTGLGPR
jgi:hypothetical protein